MKLLLTCILILFVSVTVDAEDAVDAYVANPKVIGLEKKTSYFWILLLKIYKFASSF